MKIKFHGVGAALNQTMDNTYFLIEDLDNKLQVDCGGGLGLAQKINRQEISFENIFITHKHTDHLLGFFKLTRLIRSGKIKYLNVFCSVDVEKTVRGVIDLMNISAGIKALEEGKISFINIDDKKEIYIQDYKIEPINLNSEKIEQYGFLLTYKAKKILFLGDEAIGILNRLDLERFNGVDYLICESLCPEFMTIQNGGKVDNKKICHITAKEAGEIGTKFNTKNLILIHTLEDIPGNRQEILKKEASIEYKGNIIVPNEGDILEIN